MKKYFHKLTAMLLAAAVAIPAVPPVTAEAATNSLGGLKVDYIEANSEHEGKEFVYRFETVTIADNIDMKTMVIENTGGKVVLPTSGFTGFKTQGNSIDEDGAVCVTVPENTAPAVIAEYIKAVRFVNDTAAEADVRVLFIDEELTGNANSTNNNDVNVSATMGYWNGHYYEFISEAQAITDLQNFIAEEKIDDNTGNKYHDSTHLFWSGAKVLAEQYNFLGMQGYLATLVYADEQAVVVGKLAQVKNAAAKSDTNENESSTTVQAWIGGRYVGEGAPEDAYQNTVTFTNKSVKYGTIVTDVNQYNLDDYNAVDKANNSNNTKTRGEVIAAKADEDSKATYDAKPGWYWVTEPDGPIRFLAGTPYKDGDNYYKHDVVSTQNEDTGLWTKSANTYHGDYAIGYGLPVEHVDIPAISFWTDETVKNNVEKTETIEIDTDGTATTTYTYTSTAQFDAYRDEPNNSSGSGTVLNEYCMQVTSDNAWNDLPDTGTSPVGLFVEYSGTPESDPGKNITVINAKVGACLVQFDLNGGSIDYPDGVDTDEGKAPYNNAVAAQAMVVASAVTENETEVIPAYTATVTQPDSNFINEDTLVHNEDAVTFSGNWYTCEECANDSHIQEDSCDRNTKWDFTEELTAAGQTITLYAGWTDNPTVSYVAYDAAMLNDADLSNDKVPTESDRKADILSHNTLITIKKVTIPDGATIAVSKDDEAIALETSGDTAITMKKGENVCLDGTSGDDDTFMGWSVSGNVYTPVWEKKATVSYLAYKNDSDRVTANETKTLVKYDPFTEIQITDAQNVCTSTGTKKLGIGETVTLDYLSTNANYTFWGWSKTGDTFEAVWKNNPVVTYPTDVNNGNVISSLPTTDIKIGETYYFDDNGDGTADRSAVMGTADITTPNPTDTNTDGKVFTGYTYASTTNTFTARWEKDTGLDDNGNTVAIANDNIPDKYQMKVTFHVEGCNWADDTNGTKEVFTTLYSTYGENKQKWDENGTYTIPHTNAFDVKDGPLLGYSECHGWTTGTPEGSYVLASTPFTGGKTDTDFTYRYKAEDDETIKYASDKLSEEGYKYLDINKKYGTKVLLIYGSGSESKGFTLDKDYAGDSVVSYDSTENKVVVKEPTDDQKPLGAGNCIFVGWEIVPVPDNKADEYDFALKAIWAADEINATTNATTGGDGIPDIYQKAVTFVVTGGFFENPSNPDAKDTQYIDYVTLTDDNDCWSETGSASVNVPTNMLHRSGHLPEGRWDNEEMNQNSKIVVSGGETFTYAFKKRPSSSSIVVPPVVPEEPEVPSVTPAKDPKIPEQLVEEHISYITGYEDGTVRPNNKITRAEVATILYNLLTDEMKEKHSTHENDFTDVHEHMWYNMPISTLVNMMLLSGYDDGTFGPNKYITRAEMAAILARFEVDVPLKDDVAFDDVDSSWAKDQIMLVARRGWINGYPDGTFRPDAHITRAETMAMINNMLHRNPKTLDDLHADPKYWEDNSELDEWYYIHVQEATKTHSHDRNEHGFEIRG